MRKTGRMIRASLGTISLVLPLACGSDGGPIGPGNGDPGNGDGFNVSGTWTVTATVVESTCEDVELGSQETAQVVIEHERDQISFIIEGLGTVTGTIDVGTGDFEIDVSVFVPGLGSLRLQESGRFASETRYTSEETVTFEDPEITCHFRTADEGTRTST